MRNKYERYNFVSNRAKTPKPSWTSIEVVRFHYYNPNGLYARKKKIDAKIIDLIDKRLIKEGAWYAHGAGNHFFPDKLSDFIRIGRVDRYYLNATMESFRQDCDRADEFIRKAYAGELPPECVPEPMRQTAEV